ncbi:AAA family ATPase [Candidatus Micrarchaeota archaeon]|nr:AAA family ATPase [Candidatus Micrarchaeota archaeon]
MERKFIKSGIPGLDSLLGGGFLQGSVVTVSGPTGAGKSTFAAQFLYNGAVESDEPGIYIAIEETRRDFLFHMGGYDWDFQALERDRKFILLDYPIHEVDQIVNQAAAIQEIINTTGVKRVVIDSVMPIAQFFKNDEERKTGFLKFIDNLHRWNVTTLIVSEDLKIHSGARPSSEYGIESFTDGWINLFFRYDDKRLERDRYVEVVKMKGVAHSSRACPVTLDNRGFALITERTPIAEDKPLRAKSPAPRPAAAPPEAAGEPERESRPLKTLRAPPPPPEGKPPAAPPAAKPAAVSAKAAPAPKAQAKPAPGGKSGPVKMTPALAARLAEAKKKIMKK